MITAFHQTDSGTRSLPSSAPAHTNRRLSEASKRSEFSVNVFRNKLRLLNHNPDRLSTVSLSIFRVSQRSVFCQVDNFYSPKEKHLTFRRGHVTVCTAIKKAVTKTVWLLLLQRVVGWCETAERLPKTHHFRAGEPKFVGFSRLPALRARACWSLKGRHFCRNLSGTAGSFYSSQDYS